MDTQAELEEIQELIEENAFEEALIKLAAVKAEIERRMEEGNS